MKIVFIGGRDIRSLGGIESYMYNLSVHLIKLGHEVVVYCESDHNSIEYIEGIKVIFMKGFKSNLICKPWVGLKATIRTLIKEKNISVIHYNAWPPSMWSFIPRLLGIKSLMQGHGLEWMHSKYSSRQQKVLKLMERITAHINQHLIMCSDNQTHYFKNKYNVMTTTIPTAVNMPSGKEVETDILEKYSLERCKYFLFLGRLSKEKNVDYLIDGFKRLNTQKYKLVIAGTNTIEPDFVDYLHNKATGSANIVFTGAVYNYDKTTLLSNAYAYCLISTTEGLSIALLEAMSYKLPIIASDIEGNRELLLDNAIWVRPENVNDLLNAFNDCINNRQEIMNYWEVNYNNVFQNYTWDKVTQKYIGYLSSIGVK
ncbi:glycosyltransferase family 4 protein [uncultured Bacteroides sp.]|uniref:glycosyltransferase family 4 protein n=1 Tax=uncultured Bacteroides sp. TaxID=162156 RepID=UPI00280B8393|nr:glycosyltransferase family 4 protein [uncultured Bacteroides sp.]